MLLAVKRLDFFAVFSLSHNDFRTADMLRRKSVKRLPVLHQNVICDVNNIVNRAQSNAFQIFFKPFGTFRDFHALYAGGSVKRTVRSFKLNRFQKRTLAFFRIFRGAFKLGLYKLSSELCGKLPCNAYNASAVSAVCGKLDFKNRVGIRKYVVYGSADFRAHIQNQETLDQIQKI